ncbi:MAG: hypothetical protein QM817_40340 [Archangium sp.]
MMPEPSAPAAPAAPASDPFFDQVRALVRAGPPANYSSIIVLLVIVYFTTDNLLSGLAFLSVILLRELVLIALMRITGTSDARLRYIPIGKGELAVGTTPGREAVLILGGPAFLVALSIVAFFVARVAPHPFTKGMMTSSIGLAMFTLLPLKPYDGWRVLNLALFQRSAKVELAVTILTSVLLALIGIGLKAWLLAFVAFSNVMTSLRVVKIEAAAEKFRQSPFHTVPSSSELPDEGVRELYDVTLTTFPDTMGPKQPANAKVCAQLMGEVHRRAGRVLPSVGVSALLLTVYGALVAYFVIALVIIFGFKDHV